MAKKLTKEEFIEHVQELYGNKYDYSKVNYVNNKTKVCIICHEKDEFGNEHGEFWRTPAELLNKNIGCPKCHGKHKLTKEEFIERAKEIHGDKYDYSKVEYINSRTKVCIICPEHGEFLQTPYEHLKYNGCNKCSKMHKPSVDEFIERAREIHGDKYDYSKVEYVNNKTKVCIICPEHGEFLQTPNNHLRGHGCNKCFGNRGKYNHYKIKSNTERFIKKAREIHGNRYDYSKVNYVNHKDKICIICPEHGEFWQSPMNHLQGCGCPTCNYSHMEREMLFFLEENNINFETQKMFNWLGLLKLDFYLPDYNIAIECQGKQHFEAIDYWGGEERFNSQQECDKRKYELCKQHNIKILYYSNIKHKKCLTNKNKLLKAINNKH